MRLDVTELSVSESSQLIIDWIKGEHNGKFRKSDHY